MDLIKKKYLYNEKLKKKKKKKQKGGDAPNARAFQTGERWVRKEGKVYAPGPWEIV